MPLPFGLGEDQRDLTADAIKVMVDEVIGYRFQREPVIQRELRNWPDAPLERIERLHGEQDGFSYLPLAHSHANEVVHDLKAEHDELVESVAPDRGAHQSE